MHINKTVYRNSIFGIGKIDAFQSVCLADPRKSSLCGIDHISVFISSFAIRIIRRITDICKFSFIPLYFSIAKQIRFIIPNIESYTLILDHRFYVKCVADRSFRSSQCLNRNHFHRFYRNFKSHCILVYFVKSFSGVGKRHFASISSPLYLCCRSRKILRRQNIVRCL